MGLRTRCTQSNPTSSPLPTNRFDEPFPLMQALQCYKFQVDSFSRVGANVVAHPVLIFPSLGKADYKALCRSRHFDKKPVDAVASLGKRTEAGLNLQSLGSAQERPDIFMPVWITGHPPKRWTKVPGVREATPAGTNFMAVMLVTQAPQHVKTSSSGLKSAEVRYRTSGRCHQFLCR